MSRLKKRSKSSVIKQREEIVIPHGYPGDQFLNPEKEIPLVNISCWTAGRTVIRLWNMFDPENPETHLLPGRDSDVDTAGLSNLAMTEPVSFVKMAGYRPDKTEDSRFFFSYIAARDSDTRIDGLDLSDEPYMVLQRSVERAVKKKVYTSKKLWDDSFAELVARDGDKNPPLGPAKGGVFVIASIYENGKNLSLVTQTLWKDGQEKQVKRDGIPYGEKEEDPLPLMFLPRLVYNSLLVVCNKQVSEEEDDEDVIRVKPGYKYHDFRDSYCIGDPCGDFDPENMIVRGGNFFYILGKDDERKKVTQFRAYSEGYGRGGTGQSYLVGAREKFKNPSTNEWMKADLGSDQVENMFKKFLYFWPDEDNPADKEYILRMIGLEERCSLIARGFAGISNVLSYGWYQHPEYLRFADVAAIVKNRKVVSIGDDTDYDEDEDEDEDEEGDELDTDGDESLEGSGDEAAEEDVVYEDEDEEDEEGVEDEEDEEGVEDEEDEEGVEDEEESELEDEDEDEPELEDESESEDEEEEDEETESEDDEDDDEETESEDDEDEEDDGDEDEETESEDDEEDEDEDEDEDDGEVFDLDKALEKINEISDDDPLRATLAKVKSLTNSQRRKSPEVEDDDDVELPKKSVKKSASKAPVKKSASKAPVKKSASKAPVKKPASKDPVKKPASKDPVKKPVTKDKPGVESSGKVDSAATVKKRVVKKTKKKPR